jgi:hypothetical protein
MILSLLAPLAPAQAGSIIAQTGFEAPDYVAGQPLVKQRGWYVGSHTSPFQDAATITDTTAAGGSQSARIDGSFITQESPDLFNFLSFISPNSAYDPIAAGTRYVTVSIDIRFDIDSGPTDNLAALAIWDNSVNFIGWLGLQRQADGAGVRFWGTAGLDYDTGEKFDVFQDIPDFDPNRFYHMAAEFDYETMNVAFFFEGRYLGTGPVAPPFERTFGDVTLYLDSTGGLTTSVAYFDNYLVTASAYAAPEPSSLLLAGVGVVVALVARRSRRAPAT